MSLSGQQRDQLWATVNLILSPLLLRHDLPPTDCIASHGASQNARCKRHEYLGANRCWNVRNHSSYCLHISSVSSAMTADSDSPSAALRSLLFRFNSFLIRGRACVGVKRGGKALLMSPLESARVQLRLASRQAHRSLTMSESLDRPSRRRRRAGPNPTPAQSSRGKRRERGGRKTFSGGG